MPLNPPWTARGQAFALQMRGLRLKRFVTFERRYARHRQKVLVETVSASAVGPPFVLVPVLVFAPVLGEGPFPLSAYLAPAEGAQQTAPE